MASIFLLVTISLAILCNTCQADSVDIICSNSDDRSSCDKLSSLRPGGTFDLRLLGRIIIGQSEITAKRAYITVKSFLPNTENAQVCVKNLNEAIGYMGNIADLLGRPAIDEQKKIDIKRRSILTITCIYNCEAAFGTSGPPPLLKNDTKESINLVYQIYRIAERL